MVLIFTVSEINAYLREMLQADHVVGDVWVRGEISNFKRAASGHCYFSLKEEGAVLKAAMWRAHAERLSVVPANGAAVLAHGRVSFYEAGGDLQLYVDTIRPAGVGELAARFEELRERLEAEGLFDERRKRLPPPLPRRVGVATSVQGAVLHDIVTVIARRCPLVEVLVAPCQVQGNQAAASIVMALQSLYRSGVDTIILARGGGSLEDLWGFNEEAVVRAVFASPVPLIAGVGHETDTTMVDAVADLRAPTPSAAAELAVPDLATFWSSLGSLRQQLDDAAMLVLETRQRALTEATAALRRHNPVLRLSRQRQQIDDLLRHCQSQVRHHIALHRAQVQGVQARLGALSPQATLERGYALVQRRDNGTLITQADQAAPGDRLTITVRGGQLDVTVDVRESP
ncbi:MAG: exodeoxyribonuclease VII large subunit [Chloroflexaceae bacterium]|nr:exodeoxyribonuclease VII large subunit [Chloroflexaceae bacterium]